MARRPIDPLGAIGGLFQNPSPAVPATPAPAPEVAVLGVAALSRLIRSALEGGIGRVKVGGEVSNARCVSGHWYFSLKDEEARIDCVLFRSDAARSRVTPSDGAAVVVSAQVTHYGPQGRTQLQCSGIDAVGEGDLAARFRALCDELRSAGSFDASRKKPIPTVPMCIAILTSAGSAAEADCLNAVRERFPAARVILVDIRVQGQQAAPGIAAALRAVDASAKAHRIAVVLLVRGGGSLEDLWAFNERVVADAILGMRTPVVTGIGHESDTTIADLVADLRAPTPSRAVTETLPDRAALHEEVGSFEHRLARAWTLTHERRVGRVDLAARSRALSDPTRGIEVRHAFVAPWVLRLHAASQRRIEAESARAQVLARTLTAISPLAVLERGYSITLDESGRAIKDATGLAHGDSIRTLLAHGELGSRVEAIRPDQSISHD